MPSEQHPILIFVERISYSHILRPLIISRWLNGLGHPLTIACAPDCASFFTRQGYQTVPLSTIDRKRIYDRSISGKPHYETKELLSYFAQDEEIITRLTPALVMADFRFTALQIAQKHSIPSVSISAASCHPFHPRLRFTPNVALQQHKLPPACCDMLLRALPENLLARPLLTRRSVTLRDASRSYGLTPLDDFFAYASQGDLCLLCDDPSVMPVRRLRPTDVYTGALQWENDDPLPDAIEKRDPGKKLVYISLGTDESLRTDFLAPYVKGLIDHHLQVAISRGRRAVEISVPEEKDVLVFDFVNQPKLLAQTSLFVFHGGALSTYDAMRAGTPMIALPTNIDQHFYAEGVVRNKVGCFFRPSAMRLSSLLQASLSLMADNRLKARAAELAQKIKTFSQKEIVIRRLKVLLETTTPRL